MFNIVLFEPEIPPNTGNIIRLCVNAGSYLHIIKPMAFSLDEKAVKRSGMDYRAVAQVKTYECYEEFLRLCKPARIFAVTTKAKTLYHQQTFMKGDFFVFGPETRGLPREILERKDNKSLIRVPMVKNNRSINLANTVSIILYEAWRQINFENGQ